MFGHLADFISSCIVCSAWHFIPSLVTCYRAFWWNAACVTADDDYVIVVRYASSLVDALLFIHYLAVILLEVRHLQAQFAVKVMRSPDGVSRTYTVGQLSVQRLASWCLDRYYRDFETYNPYLESIARRNSRRMTEFKVCLMMFEWTRVSLTRLLMEAAIVLDPIS